MTNPEARRLGLGQEILGGKNLTAGPYSPGVETPAVVPVYQCAHCDHIIPNGHRASFNGESLCYPEEGNMDLNCYELVSKKGHSMPCLKCFADRVTNDNINTMLETGDE